MDTNIYGYITKPFREHDIESVLAIAIKRVDDMNKKPDCKNIDLGEGYMYMIDSKRLFFNQEPIVLSKILSEVLYVFVSHINQAVSYEELNTLAWEDKVVSLSTIRDTVLRLRKKVPFLVIGNISKEGYCLRNK